MSYFEQNWADTLVSDTSQFSLLRGGRESVKTPETPRPTSNTGSEGGFSLLDTNVAAKLTRSWGPLLAFIALIAICGIVSVQLAHSDVTVLAIIAIVVVALMTALIGRIKNVL